MSFDTHIENRTPFDLATHVQLDADGQEVTVLMLSASFTADAKGQVGIAGDQMPVVFGDVPFGDPARSSTRYEADIAPIKTVAEVIVNGTAHAPDGRPVPEMTAGLQIADIRKLLQVTGDRVQHLGGLSDPNPFSAMPLVWERAFGGMADDGNIDQRNPVGIGHDGARSADPEVRSNAANITLPGQTVRALSDRPAPAGFGAVGRGWQPRLKLAGTYDQRWLDTQWPLPPHDLDPRHHLCAPRDQHSAAIGPGVRVTLLNMTPDGRWEFDLPRIIAPVRLLRDTHAEETEFRPDTVLIEPDLRRITLKARMAFVTNRTAPRLREVLFGHVSPVFLTARRKRKEYVNPLGRDGTLADVPVWGA